MTPDLMQSLHQARTTDTELDSMWPADNRTDVLRGVLRAPKQRKHSPSLRLTVLAAALVVATLVLVPTVVDSGDASAQADLRTLAQTASDTPSPLLIGDGSYLHSTTETIQTNSDLFGDGKTLVTNRESWTSYDGTVWAVDTHPAARTRDYNVFVATNEPSANNPRYAAALPDSPALLGTRLIKSNNASNSKDQAIFVAITDLARSHFLPPKTLAAALRVLADISNVETTNVTVDGHPAVQITYQTFWGRITGTDSMTVDRNTARVISENQSSPLRTLEVVTTLTEVVDQVPQNVLNMKPGTRTHY